VKVNDQGLDTSDEVRKLARAPIALRILGGAAFAWGALLGLGIIAGQVATQSLFRDVHTVGTLADWAAIVALLVAGRGLRRSRWWAGDAAWVICLGLIVFGVYWANWGTGTEPGAPLPDPLTGSVFPWPAFVYPGLVIAAMLLPKSSRAWIRQARREHNASSH
jgi:hypothetical protein